MSKAVLLAGAALFGASITGVTAGVSNPTAIHAGFIPAHHTWIVREVNATGQYYGDGPLWDVTVYFYKDDGGALGDLVKKVDDSDFIDTDGSLSVRFHQPLFLRAGIYWISIQSQMNFAKGDGEWGWVVNAVKAGNSSAWRNAGGAYGPCRYAGTTDSCLGGGSGFMFSLAGTDVTKKS